MNAIPDKFANGMQPTCCGELSPAERRDEEHLASRLICQSAASELTAHPGSAG
jgi:hypothetical protein